MRERLALYLSKLRVYATRKNVVLSLVILFSLMDIVFLVNNLQNSLPILGLKFEGKPISFASRKSLEALVSHQAETHTNPLILTYQGKTYTVSQQDLGYKVDPSYITNSILQLGRQGSPFTKFIIQLKALFGLENMKLSGTISPASLTLKLLELQEDINQKPIPIRPDFANDMTKILPAQPGIQLDSLQTASLILSNISHPPSTPLQIFVKQFASPYHSPRELADVTAYAKDRLTSPISITCNGQIFTLSITDLKKLLTVVERPDPENPHHQKLVLRLDDTKLSQKLDPFAAQIENATNTEFDYEDAQAEIYGQFYFNKRVLATIPAGNIPLKHVLAATTQNQKVAYLTFDDGPNNLYHPLILDILQQYNVKATFFLIGANIPDAHNAALATYGEGHLVGNHTLTHSFLPNYSSAFIKNELVTTNNMLKSINGNQPIKFFRPPYGGINTTVIQVAHSLGLSVFLWDVDPRDWAEPPTDVLVNRVVNAVHNGSNVLLHSNHLATVKALPIILKTLISEGYTFKTLDSYPLPEEL